MKQMIKKALAYLLAFIMTFSLSFTLLPETALAADAVLDPVSADFDKNPANQADVNTLITWNDAASVTDVKTGETSIGTENYSMSGDTLTVKKEYLASQAVGDVTLTVEFDTGTPAALTINISDTTPESAAIDPTAASFDKNPIEQTDLSTTVTWNSAASVTDIKAGETSIGTENYSVSVNTLTIKKEYLAVQDTGDLALTIEFNNGNTATLTITVGDTTPVSAVIDPSAVAFDKNPAKQADVNTTITWNSAASVTDLKANETSIGTENYSVDGSTLTIKKEYLAVQDIGDIALNIEFNNGNTSTLTITVKDTPVSAAIDPASAEFDKNPANQADVSTVISLNDASSVTDIKAGGTPIGTENYSISENTLTVKKEYLALQADGELVLTVEFDIGEPAYLTITVGDTTPVCEIGAAQYHTLGEALASIGDGEVKTIKLLMDIEYNGGIAVSGKAVTFDLNEHTLSVNNDTGNGLDVGSGGMVDITGSGAFNVASSAIGSYGVFAHDGGRAAVTNATAADCGFCVYAQGIGSRIEVKGSAITNANYAFGAFAVDESQISVGGDVRGGFVGVQASNGSLIEVSGDITAAGYGYAIFSNAGGTVNVAGSVTGLYAGLYLSGPGSTAYVGGDVNAGTTGVTLYDGSTATIDGTVTAQTNIMLQGVIKDADGAPGDTPYEKYLVYSDGNNTARMNTDAVCWIGAIPYQTLESALAGVESGETKTIRLITDIDYYQGISISGKSVTFDLNGHTLDVNNDTGVGLDVGSGGVVNITESGALNVTGGGEGSYGVYAHDGGQAKITSATSTGANNCGVYAQGTGSHIEVTGSVNSQNGIGVYATSGSTVVVGGSVNAGSTGVCAFDAGTAIIEGTITAPTYIMLQNTAKTAADGEAGQAPYGRYFIYTDGSNAVRVNVGAVCWIGAAPYQTLEDAIAAVGSGQTIIIRLVSDIDYSKGILVSRRNITFDLSGYILNVTNNGGYGLEVGSGGVVGITGSGALNVTSKGNYKYGIYAHDGGRAKVTSAAATGVSSRGVYAQGAGSRIEVTGNAAADGIGACANNGGRVIIGGDAKGGNVGAEALFSGVVEVSGNAELTGTSGYAIYVYEGATVKVTGNASGGSNYGIAAYGANSIANVGGNVTAGTGVWMSDGGKATIEGTITAPTYIMLQNAAKTAADGEPGQEPYEKYLVYTDGNNTVRANTNAVCWIGAAPYETLEAALTSIGSSEVKTIRLITNIDYDKGITVNDRTITFDLSGHMLNVTNSEGHGLEAGSGGVLDYTGSGAFNVTAGADYYGVYAHDGGRVKVTNAAAAAGDGIFSDGAGSFIEVKGSVSAGDIGIQAAGGGSAIIEGTITAPTYIMLQDTAKILIDGEPGQAPYERYFVYTDGSNIVRVNTNAVCWIGSSPYQTLDAALAAVSSGEAKTIRLINDIYYNKGIAVTGRTVTFDLSGHALSIVNNAGHGLEAGSGGVADITGSGSFNVTSGASNKYGVYAHDGGRAKVTSAAAATGGCGVYSDGTGSNIEVTGSAAATGSGSTGAAAVNGGKVSVGVDAEGSRIGAAALNGGLTEVSGDVTSTEENGYAVYSCDGGIVRVTGDASSRNGTGIYVNGSGCAASVGGDVTAGTIGVQAAGGGKASINGTLTAPSYISLGSESAAVVKTAYDGVPGKGEYTGYLVYTDESSIVLIKNPVSPANADFDRNPVNQADVSTTITWNDAASVTDVKAGEVSVGAENYSVVGNTLTIRKEYLVTFSPGELVLTVEFNTGAPAKLAVAVRDTTIYTVSLDAAGGSVSPSSMEAIYGHAYGDLPTPTRTGYYFSGWYTSADNSGIRVEKTDIFRVTDNITLHARWIKNALLALSTPSLTAKGTSYNTITLSWKAVKGAEEYQIFRWFDSIKAYDLIDTVDELSYTDTELEKGVKYYYKIRARHYPYYDPVDSKYSYASAKPAWPGIGLKAAATNYNTIQLTWNTVAGATRYEVRRCDTSYKGTYNSLGFTEDKAYTDTNLQTGHRYYYKIVAWNGTVASSPLSGYKYATPYWPGISLRAASNTYNSIKLTWNEIAGAEGYYVYRSTSRKGPFVEPTYTIPKGTGTTISYTDNNNETGLNTGTTYYYMVRAYNGTACSPYSSYKYARPLWQGISLKAASNTYNSIKLTWNEIAGAEGYYLYRSTSRKGPFVVPTYTVPKGTGTTISYTDTNNETGLNTGTMYYYKVRAYNGTACSPYSSYKYAAPALSAPVVTLDRKNINMTVSWGLVDGASGYVIYRATSKRGRYTGIAAVASGLSYTNTGLYTSRYYYYKVRAYHIEGSAIVYGPYSAVKYM